MYKTLILTIALFFAGSANATSISFDISGQQDATQLPPPQSCTSQTGAVSLKKYAGVCTKRENYILVLGKAEVLLLCDEGRPIAGFKTALGSGGLGKTQEGDKKTPAGEYPLGTPFVSEKFGYFLPIGYPTPEQVDKGYTGSAIGVHGPSRSFKCTGSSTVWFNWTKGCIALVSDDVIYSVIEWVKDRNVNSIFIRSDL